MSATLRQPADARPTAEIFARWRGGRAKVWDYTPTLSRLTIRVESRDRPGNLHVVCGGCRSMCGPFAWEGSSFAVAAAPAGGDGAAQLFADAAAGFAIRCGVVSVQEDVEPVYNSAAV